MIIAKRSPQNPKKIVIKMEIRGHHQKVQQIHMHAKINRKLSPRILMEPKADFLVQQMTIMIH